MKSDLHYMRLCLKQAKKAAEKGVNPEVIEKMAVRGKIGRFKYIPENECEKAAEEIETEMKLF